MNTASGVAVQGEAATAPELTVGSGEPPAELEITDVIVGDGPEAPANATVTTHYLGKSWSTGEVFDSSWDRGAPATFPLSGVIAGWTEGIPGMRVGGRRVLVIPPGKAYGNQSPTPAIRPGETLVFVIDLVGVA